MNKLYYYCFSIAFFGCIISGKDTKRTDAINSAIKAGHSLNVKKLILQPKSGETKDVGSLDTSDQTKSFNGLDLGEFIDTAKKLVENAEALIDKPINKKSLLRFANSLGLSGLTVLKIFSDVYGGKEYSKDSNTWEKAVSTITSAMLALLSAHQAHSAYNNKDALQDYHNAYTTHAELVNIQNQRAQQVTAARASTEISLTDVQK
ncbi:MAG TPA: hypothetical protein VHA52_08850 [Candidatus Babeliaceae bacterium]|nr:hypothetical protein [Candidatus Babeliaceae bacterium]